MKEINARGLLCPKPLMMAKKEIDAGTGAFSVVVTTEAAVTNLSRLAARVGRTVEVTEGDGEWSIAFSEALAGGTPTDTTDTSQSYAVFVDKDHVGEGDAVLGGNLMKMALYTLSESGAVPDYLLFMNSGVKLVAGGAQEIVDHVSSLIAQGTEVLVCGTCLDYYGLTDQLAVGEVSNMYDILGRMQQAQKVITV